MVKLSLAFIGPAAAAIPTHKLNNGVDFPMMSIGTWQYSSSTAEQVVKDALAQGFTHIDTANDYNNQKGVGAALKGVDRSSYFLTTKVPDGSASTTKKNLQANLDQLGLEYVDLVLVHFPPRGNSCSAMQAQWTAMEEFYNAGKARAIGVSNYCPSSVECIMKKATVTPAVNQVQYHVGMGVDPIGVKTATEKHGIHLQAYSPLGDGSSQLITGSLVSAVAKNYGKSGAQVSLRWIYENGVSLTTKTTKVSHMQEDLDVFNFELSAADKSKLDAARQPSGKPSFVCNSLEALADECTGADDIPSEQQCYSGKLGLPIPGISETITWKIKEFADGAGVIDVTSTGHQESHCEGVKVSKEGQALTMTKPDECEGGGGQDSQTVLYCSDQDFVSITASKGPAHVTASLKRIDCPSDSIVV